MNFSLKVLKVVSFLFCIIVLFSCSTTEEKPAVTESTTTEKNAPVKIEENVLKIFISENGEIFSNGKATSIEDLEAQLNELGKSKGEVYYSRANKETEPHPNALTAIKLIIAEGLPIQFFTDGTFAESAKL